MQNSGIKSVLSNASYIAAGQGVGTVVRGVYVIVLAKYLGPELYGLFAYAQSYYLLFLSLTIFGLAGLLSSELGRKDRNPAQVIGPFLALRIILLVFALGLYTVVVFVKESGGLLESVQLILIAALLGRSFSLWSETVFIGLERAKESFRLQTIWRTAEGVVGTILLVAGFELLVIAAVHSLSWMIQAVTSASRVKHLVSGLRPSWNLQQMKKILATGAPLGLSGIMMVWILEGPIIIFREIGGEGELGQVALAYRIFGMFLIFPASLARAALPILARSVDREDGKDLLFVSATIRVTLLATAAIGVVVNAFAGPVLELLLGQAFQQSGPLAGAFVWLLAPVAIATTVSSVAIGHGRTKLVLASSVVGGILMGVVTPGLAGELGAYGLVLGSAVALIGTTIVMVLPFFLMLDLENKKAILFCTAIFVVVFIYSFAVLGYEPIFASIGGIILIAVVIFFLPCFTSTEWQKVQAQWKNVGK